MSEVLDADYEAAGTCSEDLHVHAFNPVSRLRLLHPESCLHDGRMEQDVNFAWLGSGTHRHCHKPGLQNNCTSATGCAAFCVPAALSWNTLHVGVAQVFDYVPPELVSLLVTDIGGHIPSYVYRLLAEYYSREDYTLERKELSDVAMRA